MEGDARAGQKGGFDIRRTPTHHRTSVCPAELVLDVLGVEPDPLVVRPVGCRADSSVQIGGQSDGSDQAGSRILTGDKLLLLQGGDADQVGVELLAAPLRLGPGVSVVQMEVAAALELQPVLRTTLHSCIDRQT